MAEPMSNEDYIALQQQILMFGGLVREMDLRGILTRIDHADSIGPIVDPILYRAAGAQMQQFRNLVEALLTFQREVLKQLAASEKTP